MAKKSAKEAQPKEQSTPVVPAKETKKSKTPKTPVVESTPVSAPEPKKAKRAKKEVAVVAPSDSAQAESVSALSDTGKRQAPTRDSVIEEFESLSSLVEAEIEHLKGSTAKSKGVKFLRSMNKRIKTLKSHVLRVAKQRQVTKRNNNNSGFLKPVQISKDLAEFTGWKQSQPRSRVDVTKFICEHIKKNELQNPDDKREILVDKDARLKKLLNYDPKTAKPGKNGKTALTYYSLQSYLKSHFTPVAVKA
jgi:chromatin remodeling complex protein RSC6